MTTFEIPGFPYSKIVTDAKPAKKKPAPKKAAAKKPVDDDYAEDNADNADAGEEE